MVVWVDEGEKWEDTDERIVDEVVEDEINHGLVNIGTIEDDKEARVVHHEL